MDISTDSKTTRGFRTFAFAVALITTALIMTSTAMLFTTTASGFVA